MGFGRGLQELSVFCVRRTAENTGLVSFRDQGAKQKECSFGIRNDLMASAREPSIDG